MEQWRPERSAGESTRFRPAIGGILAPFRVRPRFTRALGLLP